MSMPTMVADFSDTASDKSGTRQAGATAAQHERCRIEAVSGADALEGIQDHWHDLAGRALERNILISPAMAIAACRHLPEAKQVVWLLAWLDRDDQAQPCRLIGLFPLTYSRLRWAIPLPAASFWHNPYGFLTTPLVDTEHADAALAALFGWLSAKPGRARLLALRFLRDGGPVHTLLLRQAARHGLPMRAYWAHRRAALYGGERGEAYLKRALSRKRLKEYRRLESRLSELGDLQFSIARSTQDLARAVPAFTQLEARGWKGKRGTALANNPASRAFLEEAVRGLSQTGSVEVAQLTLDGTPVAAAILLTGGDEAWLWKIAYDEDHARLSPGVLLVLRLTRALLDDGALARVDSCALPDHPMIDHIWRDRLAMTDLLVELRPGLLPARAVFCLESLRRGARDRLKAAWKHFKGSRS